MKPGNQKAKPDQLKLLLERQTAELRQQALKTDGNINEDKLKEIERLAHLIELQNLSQPETKPLRWPVIAALLMTLAIASLLLFARVSSTEIEMDITLSEVDFRLPIQQLLSEDMNLSSLGVSGMKEVKLPRSATSGEEVLQESEDQNLAIRLAPATTNAEPGSVTLAAMLIPAKTHLSFKPFENSGQYRLSMSGPATNLRAGVNGIIKMGRPGLPEQALNIASPRAVEFKSGNKNIDIDLKLLPETSSRFSRLLHIDSLNLFSIEQHVDGDQTVVRVISSILSGSLFYESLGGKEQRIRSGQELRFSSSKGEIRTLELKDDKIAFSFHGVVKGMTTGNDENEVSLMPTYLEWLSARHGLSLLWGTTLYFFGLMFTVFKWWREKK